MDCLEGYASFGSSIFGMILIYSNKMMGFGFLGLAKVQRVAMNLVLHLPGVGAMWNMNLLSLTWNG